MSSIAFYLIDTETNGLLAKHHEITEISIIRYVDRVQLSRNIKCNFPERSSLDALRITGKTLSDLSVGENKSKVIKDCNDFFNQDGLTKAHRCIVGHNIIKFDKKFLHALWEEEDQQFPADLFLDTMVLMKEFNKSRGVSAKVNLDASCNSLGIKKFAGAHTAKGDTRNTYLLFNKLIKDYNFDYLPYIKNFPHSYKSSEEELANLLNELEDNPDTDREDYSLSEDSD